GSCLGDLFGCPRIPTVAGHGDHDRYGGPVLATKGRVGDVHIAKERARCGIVRPDLVFVRVEGRVLLGNKDWLQPSVLIACRLPRQAVSRSPRDCEVCSDIAAWKCARSLLNPQCWPAVSGSPLECLPQN